MRAALADASTTVVDAGGLRGFGDAELHQAAQLPDLQHLELYGTSVTDAGVAALRGCTELRDVNLAFTPTGDGALRALGGLPHLHRFRSGSQVTDDGVAALHDWPVFKTWQGGVGTMGLTSYDAGPNYLMLRGAISDRGVAALRGLDGLFALNLDDRALPITGPGLAPLASLPHLGWLAVDAKDDWMPHIAALPRLRFLAAQDTTAGDDGFVALAASRTIEYIWGRRCHNLRRRGFLALADMPALRALSVSCRNVDDEGIAALPRFPALRELMPMDVPDAGYRHVGRCVRLESLVLMYCRDTTDAATEQITGLPRLTSYFNSFTAITDRTPALLATMPSLERVIFDGCDGLTDQGIAQLARLPRLKEVSVQGRGVTPQAGRAFAPGVAFRYFPHFP